MISTVPLLTVIIGIAIAIWIIGWYYERKERKSSKGKSAQVLSFPKE